MFSIGFCNLLDVKIDCNHAYVMLLLSNLFFPPLNLPVLSYLIGLHSDQSANYDSQVRNSTVC